MLDGIDKDPMNLGGTLAGKIALVYANENQQHVIRYYHYRGAAWQTPLIPLNVQYTIDLIGAKELTGIYPTFIEHIILRKTTLRKRKGDTLEQYLNRVEEGAEFSVDLVEITPPQIVASFKEQVQNKVLLLDGLVPYKITSSCLRSGYTCPYVQLCCGNLLFDGSEGARSNFVDKETLHPELERKDE